MLVLAAKAAAAITVPVTLATEVHMSGKQSIVIFVFIFGPGLIGTALWLYTSNPAWLFTWAWTLILGLAG